MPRPLLGKPSVSVCLDFHESDGGRQSTDALQDLVKLTRPCFWRLLPRFVGRELLSVLLFLSFLGTGFWSGVPFPLVIPFVGVRFGFFIPSYCLGTPLLAGEHAGQREGKDVPVSL